MSDVRQSSTTGSGGHMIVSLGYEARGQQALLQVQKDDTELQRIQRELNQDYLEMQNDTMKANVKAVQESAHADALSDYMDAGNYGAQAAADGLNAGVNAKARSNFNEDPENVKIQERLNAASDFETRLQEAPEARAAMGDDEYPQLSRAQQARLKELTAGTRRYDENEQLDRDVLEHIKASDRDHEKVVGEINKTKDNAIQQQQTKESQFSHTVQQLGLFFSIGKNALITGFKAAQGWIADNKKGPAEATKVLAQVADQNIQASLSQGLQMAETYDSQAVQLNRAREALAGGMQG